MATFKPKKKRNYRKKPSAASSEAMGDDSMSLDIRCAPGAYTALFFLADAAHRGKIEERREEQKFRKRAQGVR